MYNTPHNYLNDFQEADIQKVWDELHLRFSFNEKKWKEEFKSYLGRQSRNTTIDYAFIMFGRAMINPVLNQILGRPSHHPTFNAFVEYILAKKNRTKRPAGQAQGSRKA